MENKKNTQGVKLISVVPRGWVNQLSERYNMARKNMSLVLSGDIQSDRAKIIRSEVRELLIKHYENIIDELKYQAPASN